MNKDPGGSGVFVAPVVSKHAQSPAALSSAVCSGAMGGVTLVFDYIV